MTSRLRNASGEFVRPDGSQRADRKPRHAARNRFGEFVNAVTRRNASPRSRHHADWKAYLEARYNAAEEACRGYIARRGSAAALIHGGGALTAASEEFLAWLATNGPCLRFSEYVTQVEEHREHV